MSGISKITIKVPSDRQDFESKGSFHWIPADLSSSRHDEDISKMLFGAPYTLTILRMAFKAGLSRDVSWDISQIPGDLRSSYLFAARVFRRGVAIAGEASAHSRLRDSLNQDYDVQFVDQVESGFSRVNSRDLVLVDENVAHYWRHRIPCKFVSVPFSEASKDLNMVSHALGLIKHHAGADGGDYYRPVHVVGGGVAGDVVGFAAGLAGVRCHYVPTTLLSMVDSSVGGKVGVNFETWGKNQLGLFHPPASVTVCSSWLSTLSERELKSGLAEALKHALLSGDMGLWRHLGTLAMTPGSYPAAKTLLDIARVKKDIVERDPFERGERVLLNFGHTLGHALESIALRRGIHVTHGECVALGMVHALRLSGKYRGLNAESLIADLLRFGVLPPIDVTRSLLDAGRDFSGLKSELGDFLTQDKKANAQGGVSYVLLDAPGRVARQSPDSWMVGFSMEAALEDIKETRDFLLARVY